jgi:vacuolar-type H+-ATPase subunit F/Vma7
MEEQITELTEDEKSLKEKFESIVKEKKSCSISFVIEKIYENFGNNYELLQKKQKTNYLNYLEKLIKINFPSKKLKKKKLKKLILKKN